MDTLGAVLPGAHALALLAGAALAVAAVAALRALAARRRAGLPEAAERLVAGALERLGDGVLVVGRDGRITRANAAAERLAGSDAAPLAGKDLATVAEALAVLRHGLRRADATSGAVSLRTGVRATAALVRVSDAPTVDVVVLRAEPARAAPPPLPASRPATGPAPARLGDVLAGAAACVRAPIARAATAASYLRLLAPPLPPRAAKQLSLLDEALEEAARRVGTLHDAAEKAAGTPRALELAPLVADLLAAWAPPPGVRVRSALEPALAMGDDRPLRAAIREALRAVGAGAGRGGEIAVSVGRRGAAAVVEIAGGAAADDGGAAAVARALVAPHGGQVEDEAVPGRGRTLRILLPRAADAVTPDAPQV
ncbi:PAS domain-containing protein [Anaeromyxobacter terrae]|uniref:PAS domain-containing protein n=1 Tax=Anaeromyxobacter terrae TaxID=2925406 RepID=UPI001F56A58B|nr:PAS domain-containing protein [Anaeromyxobacter sp. SG22]